MNEQKLYAGAASRDITPGAGTYMDGYGVRGRTSLGKYDPLYVKALYLSFDDPRGDDGSRAADGKTTARANDTAPRKNDRNSSPAPGGGRDIECGNTPHLFLTLDVCGASEELEMTMAASVCARLGLPREALTLAFTHTHSGPACGILKDLPFDWQYWRGVIDIVCECAAEARSKRAPVTLKIYETTADIGVNRREVRDGRVVLGQNEAGDLDRTVRILAFYPECCELCAPDIMIVHASCHPTSLGGDNRYISADYPGALYRRMAEVYPHTAVLFINGGAGEVNPRRLPDEDGLERAHRTGAALAEAVLAAIAHCSKTDIKNNNEQISYDYELTSNITGFNADKNINAKITVTAIPQAHDNTQTLPNSDTQSQPPQTTPASVKQLRRFVPVTFAALPPLPELMDKLTECYLRSEEVNIPGRPPGNPLVAERNLKWYGEAVARKEHGSEVREKAVPIQLMELNGEILFVQMPFETFSSTVKKIVGVAQSAGYRHENVFVCGYANGVYGYLTPDYALCEGGYESESSYMWYGLPAPYDERCETGVIDAIADMINVLRN